MDPIPYKVRDVDEALSKLACIFNLVDFRTMTDPIYSGFIVVWITFEPVLWIANMTDGPHRLQLTHEGLPALVSSYSFQANHPAHLPLIWLFVTLVLCEVIVTGSITLISLENFPQVSSAQGAHGS
ncbi:hypothetical protein B0A54_17635 [Friedmanniomyces endolithicus]|uniref:Uncharacterized protein n=1 Tax=Friedmanniomyces endolithicus TaxID=329885 RepID=A0A4U0TVC7_9PEZI|nr:hypothetical protein LTS09_017445 [Friedmanniomyces endolithicus]TKA26224.1 hypothetical protein B0A54_17635 [Friedmanniomyces endolithicus]